MTPPPISIAKYTLVFVSLLVLVLATTLIGFLSLGAFNMIIAVAIACVMASLVAGFFMQALYEGKIVRIILCGGVVWFLIMETLTLGDYMTRGWLPFPGK